MSALLTAKQRGDPSGWRAFQERVHALKNQRTRAKRETEDLETSLFAAQTALRLQAEGALGKNLALFPILSSWSMLVYSAISCHAGHACLLGAHFFAGLIAQNSMVFQHFSQ